MTWYYSRNVLQTFTWYGSQWAWANISGLGWMRIRDGAADGCTNLHVLLQHRPSKRKARPRGCRSGNQPHSDGILDIIK
jgi:hypothetical protein